jgi:hypothetical protein
MGQYGTVQIVTKRRVVRAWIHHGSYAVSVEMPEGTNEHTVSDLVRPHLLFREHPGRMVTWECVGPESASVAVFAAVDGPDKVGVNEIDAAMKKALRAYKRWGAHKKWSDA